MDNVCPPSKYEFISSVSYIIQKWMGMWILIIFMVSS